MSEYTEGTWFVGEPDKNGQAIVRNADIEIATCWHHCVGAIEKEMHNNARLFAASKELLAACKMALPFFSNHRHYERGEDSYQALLAAIAKAEGR